MKQNPSDMEINNNNWEDNCIDVDEIARRNIVRLKPLVENNPRLPRRGFKGKFDSQKIF